MNQTEDILTHFKLGYSITSMEAFELYGATRLSAIIFNLRKKGYNIQKRKKPNVNRYGKVNFYAEYYLIEE